MPRFYRNASRTLFSFILFLSAASAFAETPAWLGLLEGLAAPTPTLAKVGPGENRQEIRLIVPGGPAEKAGLKRGDVLLQVEGRPMMDEPTVMAPEFSKTTQRQFAGRARRRTRATRKANRKWARSVWEATAYRGMKRKPSGFGALQPPKGSLKPKAISVIPISTAPE